MKELIRELKDENTERSRKMNGGKLTEYGHTVSVHTYNNTLDIIKRMEKLL